jgi:hypothetical protein
VYGFIPYGRGLVPIRSDVGLFVTLALSGVSVIGVCKRSGLTGWPPP